jgi:hypothetical protein
MSSGGENIRALVETGKLAMGGGGGRGEIIWFGESQ